MLNKEFIMNIFNYIQGEKRGREANKLEYEAMEDSFLADALDGYNATKGNHKSQIEKLQKRVKNKCRKKPNYLLISGIAASVAILIGAGAYLVIFKPDTGNMFAVVDQKKSSNDIIAQSTTPAVKEESKTILDSEQTDKPAKATDTPAIQPGTKAEESQKTEIMQAAPVIQPETTTKKEEVYVAQAKRTDSMQMADANPVNTRSAEQERPASAPKTVAEQTQPTATANVAAEQTNVTTEPAKPEAEEISNLPKIKGKVTDANGNPIPGATISIIGANKRTTSNANGYFELEGENNSDLMIRSRGYDPVSTRGTTDRSMTIVLEQMPEQ